MPDTPSRRTFLQASVLSPFALAGALPDAAQAAVKHVRVVDAHLHCFAGKDDKRFPYHAKAPYQPEAAATPQHLLKCMDGAGVDYAIVVHPEPYQDDHRYLEYCLKVGKGRLKGTCLFFAGRKDAAVNMKQLARKQPIVALRIHAYAPERLPPFGKPELRQLWKQAADLGLAVQLHLEPRYAPSFEALIKEFSKTRVLIDHLGRPFQGSPKEYAAVVRWSRFPNTVMKLSAIPSNKTYPHRKIQPVIKQLTDAFGAERLMYGGGFGAEATGKSYKAAREQTRALIAHLSAADQAKVLGGTAAKIIGFTKSG
jgi:predicted TIM-barrel fold metal-dependent hydrolase